MRWIGARVGLGAGSRFVAVFLLAAASPGTGPALALEETPETPETPPEEERSGPKITLHGYLTQAYAQSDGHQIFGIPEEGTADYRTAAVQLRADVTEDDNFIVQLSHERFGSSQIQETREDVELDWMFYEHRFGSSAVKVGRVQIPFGIYAEVRDVGTLLPFYRPSHNFYGDIGFAAEALDGVVLSHSFDLGRGWGLDGDLHYGEWEFTSRDFFTGRYVVSKVDDSGGAELWLDTPVSGLRLGAGAMRFDIVDPFSGQEQRWKQYHLSLSGEFDRFAFHVEHKDVDILIGHVLLTYAHLGVDLTEKLTVNAQQDLFDITTPGQPRADVDDDRILGLAYAFRPSLVLKAEHHWNEGGFYYEDQPPFAPASKVKYWIVSLSTSF